MLRATAAFGCGIALAAIAGCANDGGTPPPTTEMCLSPSMCDDGIDCTVDTCGVSGTCEHTAISERCPAGQTCDPTAGCLAELECADASDCDDAVDCTLDMCVVGNRCDHLPINERCADMGGTCDPVMGCVGPTGCTSAAECDDAVDCTADECGADMRCAHTPLNELCDDGEVCSVVGCSLPCTTDDECQDADFCNGRERCDPEFGCRPAPTPRECADADACTVDTCVTDLNRCAFMCDPSMAGCDCPVLTPDYNGTFDISPAPMQRCASDGMGGMQVDYNISSVTFTYTAALLSVAAGVPRTSAESALTQMPAPTGADFDVSTSVAGTCEEVYRLSGAFVDADTFIATWTAQYIDRSPPIGCFLIPTCANQSLMVMGTRR